MVKNLPAMQETQFWSQGQKDPLEKGMDNHSSILTWEIPWTEEPGGLQRVRHNWAANTLFSSEILSIWAFMIHIAISILFVITS